MDRNIAAKGLSPLRKALAWQVVKNFSSFRCWRTLLWPALLRSPRRSRGTTQQSSRVRLEANGLRPSSARLASMGDVMQLLDRLRARKEVANFGSHEVKVDWLGFHVPQGGTGSLTLKATREGGSSVNLKFLGFGGGARRAVTLTAERDFGDREGCFYLGVTLELGLRAFAEGGASEANVLQVDIERLVGSYLRSEPACPLCFADRRKPLRARPTGRAWDLTADAKGLTETIGYDLEEALELEVGFDIPLASSALKPAVEISRSVKSACSASYKFPGGVRFTGYQMIGKVLDLEFWGKG